MSRFFITLAVLLWTQSALAESAAEIVAASDQVRNPDQPFRVALTIVEYLGGEAHDAVGMIVHSKLDPDTRQYRNLVAYTAPPRDAGKLVLFDASKMWFYDPASKASIRISAQQRLIGQASNGDVLTVNLAHDYAPKLLGEETIQDADHQPRNTWHLDLAAATRDAVYTRLEIWIEKRTHRPVKARFYSDSGRLLKLAFYRAYQEQLGGVRPAELIIVDAVDTHLVTRVTWSGFRAEDVRDEWFQREYLPRFSE